MPKTRDEKRSASALRRRELRRSGGGGGMAGGGDGRAGAPFLVTEGDASEGGGGFGKVISGDM